MDVKLITTEGNKIDMDALDKETQNEERKINSTIRSLTREGVADNITSDSDELAELFS